MGAGSFESAASQDRAVGVSITVPHIVEARHVSGYTLWLKFSDGAEGEVDLGAELHGEVFEPLKDPSHFQSFQVHPELKTVVWPSGAEFAPEFLRAALRVVA